MILALLYCIGKSVLNIFLFLKCVGDVSEQPNLLHIWMGKCAINTLEHKFCFCCSLFDGLNQCVFLSVHVVFGHLISGQEVIQTIENQKTDANSRPYAEVKVLNCGELIPKSKGWFVANI